MRRQLAAFVRSACAPYLGLHDQLITIVPSLREFHIALHGNNSTTNEPGKYYPQHVVKAAPSSWPHSHVFCRHAAGGRAGASANVAEEFDLMPPETGTVRIDGYDETGFIVGDVQVEGSILCYADLWLAWAPRSLTQVTMDTLTLVDLAKPVPDLVVLGTGRRIQPPPRELAAALEERGVSIEAVDTINAVATFNILNQEGRKVVGAMLPANAD